MPQTENEAMEIDLLKLLKALLKRWWIILLFVVFAAGAAYYVTDNYMVPMYSAHTSLFLGKEKDKLGSISIADLQTNDQLVIDYTQIIKSKLCTNEVIKKLNLKMNVGEFQSRIGVSTIQDSRLFVISFISSDPRLAADVANAMAQVIIEKAADIIEVNNVKVIDKADVPTAPYGPSKKKNMMTAAMIGFALAAGLIILMELLDHTFKKAEDIERQLGLNPLGIIPRFAGEKRNHNNKAKKSEELQHIGTVSKNLISFHDPRSAASEAYRTLRTNLSYSGIDKKIKTIVITSPGVEDGKSTSACNLAVSFAQNGQKVLLIDADLRKPKLRHYFGLLEDNGLTDILTGKGEFENYITSIKDIVGLSILTSGTVPPNPTELLSTRKMKTLIQELNELYEIVIIDTPPVAELTDAAITATLADGVLLVLSAGETNIELAKKAKKVLENVAVRILGAVMVKVERQGKDRYYYYYSKKKNVKA